MLGFPKGSMRPGHLIIASKKTSCKGKEKNHGRVLINSAIELLNPYLGNYGLIKLPAVGLAIKGKVAACSDVTKTMREEVKLIEVEICLGLFQREKMKKPQ